MHNFETHTPTHSGVLNNGGECEKKKNKNTKNSGLPKLLHLLHSSVMPGSGQKVPWCGWVYKPSLVFSYGFGQAGQNFYYYSTELFCALVQLHPWGVVSLCISSFPLLYAL